MTLMRVVFPDPFGPIRMLTFRSSTSRVTPSSARRLPNSLLMLCTDRMFAAMRMIQRKEKRGGRGYIYGGLVQLNVSVFEVAVSIAGVHWHAKSRCGLTVFDVG